MAKGGEHQQEAALVQVPHRVQLVGKMRVKVRNNKDNLGCGYDLTSGNCCGGMRCIDSLEVSQSRSGC